MAARYSLRVHKSQDIRKQAGSTTALQLEAVTSSEHHDAGGEEDLEMEVAGRLGSICPWKRGSEERLVHPVLTCADCLNYRHIQKGREGHKGLHYCPVPQLMDVCLCVDLCCTTAPSDQTVGRYVAEWIWGEFGNAPDNNKLPTTVNNSVRIALQTYSARRRVNPLSVSGPNPLALFVGKLAAA